MASSPVPARGVGASLLALFLVLVVLLGLFAAGGYLLSGGVRGEMDGWERPAVMMLALAAIHAVLAWGVWRARPWVRWFVLASIAAMIVATVLDASRHQVLDLGAALWLLLAGAANFAVLAWAWLWRAR